MRQEWLYCSLQCVLLTVGIVQALQVRNRQAQKQSNNIPQERDAHTTYSP